jgi:hypothetical protein
MLWQGLWAILIAVVWIVVRYYMSIFSSVFGRGRHWLTRVLGLILLILVPFGVVSIALVQIWPFLSFVTWPMHVNWYGHAIPLVATVAFNVISVSNLVYVAKPILSGPMRWYDLWSIMERSILLLAAIVAFSVFVYPQIPRAFGGGARPTIKLLLSEKYPFGDSIDLPLSDDGKTIGPVLLLRQTENILIVTKIPQPTNWLQDDTRRPLSAISLGRASIAAIVFNPTPE